MRLVRSILGFVFLHVSLFGGEFILSSSYFSSLPTPKSKAILKDYERFMNETRTKPLDIQLQAVNFYINTIVPQYDEQTYQSEDYWASRGEFLSHGGGDCEDYAIAKFYSLKDLGMDAKQMALCIVKEKGDFYAHMVLLVLKSANTDPLVLDNMSFKVLTLNERYDISLKECMNETGVVQLKRREFVRIPSQGVPRTYYQMLERSHKEHLWQEKIK